MNAVEAGDSSDGERHQVDPRRPARRALACHHAAAGWRVAPYLDPGGGPLLGRANDWYTVSRCPIHGRRATGVVACRFL
jgi:hypothetical protein